MLASSATDKGSCWVLHLMLVDELTAQYIVQIIQ